MRYRRSPSRPPGAQNKITRILKEAILQAAATVGKPRFKRNRAGQIEALPSFGPEVVAD